MKRNLLATALALSALPAFAADVGLSVSVAEPGFYGRIDIGNVAPPTVYAQPVLVQTGPVAVSQPIYLHVPPGHAKNWRKYCGNYNACGQPVHFVQDTWYNDVYVPQQRARKGGHEKGHGHGKGKKD